MSKKPVPKKRTTVAKTKSRYSRYQYEKRRKLDNALALDSCRTCGAVKKRHFLCLSCGEYKGVKIVDVVKYSKPLRELEA